MEFMYLVFYMHARLELPQPTLVFAVVFVLCISTTN